MRKRVMERRSRGRYTDELEDEEEKGKEKEKQEI